MCGVWIGSTCFGGTEITRNKAKIASVEEVHVAGADRDITVHAAAVQVHCLSELYETSDLLTRNLKTKEQFLMSLSSTLCWRWSIHRLCRVEFAPARIATTLQA